VRPDVVRLSSGWAFDYKFVLNPPGLRAGQINRILNNVPGIHQVLEIKPMKYSVE